MCVFWHLHECELGDGVLAQQQGTNIRESTLSGFFNPKEEPSLALSGLNLSTSLVRIWSGPSWIPPTA